jgi:hypothetical protein
MDDRRLPSTKAAWRLLVLNSISAVQRRGLGKCAVRSTARPLAFAAETGEAVEGRGPSQQEIIAHYARKRGRASRVPFRPRPWRLACLDEGQTAASRPDLGSSATASCTMLTAVPGPAS